MLVLLFLQRPYEFILNRLFFLTWEDRGNFIKLSSIIRSNFFAINFFKRRNYLTAKDGFPTPYYYTNRPNGRMNSVIFIKQLKCNAMKATPTLLTLIERAEDASYEMLEAFGMTEDMTPEEVRNVNIIMEGCK